MAEKERGTEAPADWRERISVDPDICHGKPCIGLAGARGKSMTNFALDELLELPPAERVAIAEALWDSVLGAPEAADLFPLAPEQAAEIDRRLAEHDRDPSTAIPWDEVRRRLLAPR